jgi:hypothetical protein
MSTVLKAIETTGVAETPVRLRLDTSLPTLGSRHIKVIVLFTEEDYQEPDEAEWLYAAATNPAFEFLKEPREDIYTLSDGRPFDDQG